MNFLLNNIESCILSSNQPRVACIRKVSPNKLDFIIGFEHFIKQKNFGCQLISSLKRQHGLTYIQNLYNSGYFSHRKGYLSVAHLNKASTICNDIMRYYRKLIRCCPANN